MHSVDTTRTKQPLLIMSPDQLGGDVIHGLRSPFATLIALESHSVIGLEPVVEELIAAGCKYFVCAGPNAELIHDFIDDLIVSDAETGITTTFHEDESEEEVANFFLTCAASGMTSLIALVESGSELERVIRVHSCTT